MIERNTEAYLKLHREERERASAHRQLLEEARLARKARLGQKPKEPTGAAGRPAPSSVVRLLARFVLERWGRPLRP